MSVFSVTSCCSGSGGGSSSGSSWSGTSTMGSYTNTGPYGLYTTAYALVPVGADGLAFAMQGTATNLVGDYLITTGDDLLSSGSYNPPGTQGLQRGYGTELTAQRTLASPTGAASTREVQKLCTRVGWRLPDGLFTNRWRE